MSKKALWELLVPTQMERKDKKIWNITTRYHRVWDKKVRDISGGLTVLRPAKGHWVSPTKEVFVERMIPVRIYCNKEEIMKISDFTAEYYNQEAIMFYKISDEVYIKLYKEKKND